MKLSVPSGTTSKRIAIFIQDSSSTTGAGLTGLTNASSSLVCYSWIDTDGNAGGTAQALQSATRGTWTTRGFIEKDATNMPGFYEFGVPDALLAAGVKWAIVMFKGATNMAPCPVEIEVTATSNQDAVRGGMTALPNANAEAAGGLYTRGSGAGQINQPANGQIDANTVKVGGTTQTARDLGASVLLAAGTGTGQLDFTSGVVKANGTQILGGAIPAVNVTGVPLVDLKYTLGTISPAAAGSVSPDWGQVVNKTTSNALTGTTISTSQVAASVTAGVTVTTNSDKTGYALTSGERTSIADALLDETNGVETNWTLRQVLRIMFSALAGKLDGAATTTIHTRDQADGKNRITATCDSSGNRTAITLDAS